jgi:hypothetical protein
MTQSGHAACGGDPNARLRMLAISMEYTWAWPSGLSCLFLLDCLQPAFVRYWTKAFSEIPEPMAGGLHCQRQRFLNHPGASSV